MAPLSIQQRWVLVIIKMISGWVSLFASSIIIYHILLRYYHKYRTTSLSSRNMNNNNNNTRVITITPFHRLILGLSILDVLYSFWSALGTIPVPANTGAILGYGTTATCTAQGFFTQFVISTPIYLASLSMYFLLKIRYNISDDSIYRNVEFWLHCIPWTVAIVIGSTGIFLQIYNPMPILEMGCWLSASPPYCVWSPIPCTRGYRAEELSWFYTWFFSHGWIYGSFVVVLVCNVLIYCAIRTQERRNQMYLVPQLLRSQQNSASQQYDRNSSQLLSPNLAISATSLHDPSNQELSNSLSSIQCRESAPETIVEHTENINTSNQHLPDDKEQPIASSIDGFSMDENYVDNHQESMNNQDDDNNNVESNVARAEHNRQKSFANMIRGSSSRIMVNNNNSNNNNSNNNMKMSRTALTQSILYVTTSFSTVVWITTPSIPLEFGITNIRVGYFFAIMMNGVLPLQGLFTLIIFVRLDYVRRRHMVVTAGNGHNNNKSRLQCVRECLFSPDIYESNNTNRRRNLVS